MPELNEDNFELIDRNKDAMLQRNKLKYLEDRVATLEKSVGALNTKVGSLVSILAQVNNGDNNAK
jgi:hypothetical protein